MKKRVTCYVELQKAGTCTIAKKAINNLGEMDAESGAPRRRSRLLFAPTLDIDLIQLALDFLSKMIFCDNLGKSEIGQLCDRLVTH